MNPTRGLWLHRIKLFPEAERFNVAIKYAIISTKNYHEIGKCRLCGNLNEPIEHIINDAEFFIKDSTHANTMICEVLVIN